MGELRSILTTPLTREGLRRLAQTRATVSIVPGRDRVFRLFFSALGALSVVAVCIENGLHPLFLLLVPVVIVGLMRDDYALPLIGSEKSLAGLLPVYGVLASLVIIFTSGKLSLPLFLVYFTVGIVIVRALLPLTDRNISQLILLSAGLVLINCILTNNILFGVTLVLYLFSLMGTLLYFNLARNRAALTVASFRQSAKRYPQRWLITLAKSVGVILVLCAGLFIVAPRPYALIPGIRGSIPGAGGDMRRQISYRDMANMAGLHRIAFRVRSNQAPLSGSPYWRGSVLDHTDGAGWSASERVQSRFGIDRSFRSRRFSYAILPYRLQSSIVCVTGTPVLAYGRDGRSLPINARREVLVNNVFLFSDAYEVYAVDDPIPFSSHDKGYDDATAVTPRIKELALAWTQGATTARQKAQALMARLKTGFRYELRLPPPPADVNPIEHFLFVTRKGNCEYFAGAMGLMLRAVGVPCRLVEGFMGMEETDEPNEYVVRFYHAHAWVEALLDESHWTALDPTPPGTLHVPNRIWLWLTDVLDYVEFEWLRSVVNFDRSDQLKLLRGLSELHLGGFQSPVSVLLSAPRAYFGIAVAAVLLLIIALIARSSLIRGKSPSRIYMNTMKAMVRKGMLKQVHPWHEQNVQEIVRKAPSVDKALAAFMEAYLRARFDPRAKGPSPSLRQARRQLLAEAGHSHSPSMRG